MALPEWSDLLSLFLCENGEKAREGETESVGKRMSGVAEETKRRKRKDGESERAHAQDCSRSVSNSELSAPAENKNCRRSRGLLGTVQTLTFRTITTALQSPQLKEAGIKLSYL